MRRSRPACELSSSRLGPLRRRWRSGLFSYGSLQRSYSTPFRGLHPPYLTPQLHLRTRKLHDESAKGKSRGEGKKRLRKSTMNQIHRERCKARLAHAQLVTGSCESSTTSPLPRVLDVVDVDGTGSSVGERMAAEKLACGDRASPTPEAASHVECCTTAPPNYSLRGDRCWARPTKRKRKMPLSPIGAWQPSSRGEPFGALTADLYAAS
ncbi:hypothetical protein L1887_47423 [Cichorium endivia]|nr:hypothetical protein L1887_47423 [Cichorium endivia]